MARSKDSLDSLDGDCRPGISVLEWLRSNIPYHLRSRVAPDAMDGTLARYSQVP